MHQTKFLFSLHIGFELWRNLGLALVCVFVITLLLLANIPICLMVLLCVALTLVDMVGILHFWGITIDTLSCINIVLAIGIVVTIVAFQIETDNFQWKFTGSSMCGAVFNSLLFTRQDKSRHYKK